MLIGVFSLGHVSKQTRMYVCVCGGSSLDAAAITDAGRKPPARTHLHPGYNSVTLYIICMFHYEYLWVMVVFEL